MGWLPVTTAGRVTQRAGTNPGGLNPAGGHTGEDRAVPVGTPLHARGPGLVLHAGPLAGSWSDNPWLLVPAWAGSCTVIDYGPFISIYAHCSAQLVRAGDRVKAGQIVSLSGNTGTATTGPHVHEEALPDGWDVLNGMYGRVDPRIYDTAPGAITAQGTTTKREETPMPEREPNRIVLATDGTSPDVWRCEAGRRWKLADWREVQVIKDLANRGVLDVYHGGPEYRLEDIVQTVWLLDALGVQA